MRPSSSHAAGTKVGVAVAVEVTPTINETCTDNRETEAAVTVRLATETNTELQNDNIFLELR